jgi:phosphoribosyl 1,2-cyclic phosphodiesterase
LALVFRFKSLGSGSAGNATLIESHAPQGISRVLIDCGLTMSELSARLGELSIELCDIDALFVTHEHTDHVGNARQFGIKSKRPIWMSQGTQLATQALSWGLEASQIQTARDLHLIQVGSLQITPFTVPHDAREPLQVTLTNGRFKLGLVTDLGHASEHVVQALQDCHALIIESNHDSDMLRMSKYPSFLKSRISGPLGHLSNRESAELLKRILHPNLRQVVAAHLSERNNSPQLVQDALCPVLNCEPDELIIAHAEHGSPWIVLE